MSDSKAKRWVIGAMILIYAGLILVSFAKNWSQQKYYDAPYTKSNAEPTGRSHSQSSIVGVNPSSVPLGHPCDQSRESYDGDLCQQWRMAESAENLANLTWGQIAVTTFEVALLVAVLVFTVRATQQAARSADAAIKANQQSRETMVIENRPWLLIESLEPASDLKWDGDYCEFSYRVVFKNFGKSPARCVNIWGYQMILGSDESPAIIHQILSKNPPSFVTAGDTVAQDKRFDRTLHVGFSKSCLANEDHGLLIIVVRVQYSTLLDNEVRQSRYVSSVVKKKDGSNVSVTAGEAFVPIGELALEPYPFCEDYVT